ncbi:M48 family metallopeptidase [Zhouia sp. PK063]|uniref:M48 family metallopeptidase n=1 Tax=Zhouia sp. PK063 TaxID=3373602 RepID=UPI0037948889
MKKILISIGLACLVVACATNPFTGKKTLNFVSNSQLFPTAFQQYDEFLKENQVVTGTAEAQKVKEVGQRIAAAAQKWLTANGYSNYLDGYEWEYHLVKSDEVNAWCMPGGKIVVYTGILPITQDEAGLAVVLGHEVAHALANHGAQRMSASQIQQYVGLAGSLALSGKSEQTQQIFAQAYGVGTQVGVMLPFSRNQESEADAIGIQLMALAGYDPYQAPKLWERMQAKSGGSSVPELLSTHPSSQSRIQNLTALAPQAETQARKYGVTSFQK